MTTTLAIISILFSRLDGSALKNAITGSICKQKRDGNSRKEDVVINCLPVNNTALQTAIANVNIYVPDIKVEVNGMQDTQPNIARLEELAAMAVEVLDDYWSGTYNFYVQQQHVFDDPESGCHYVNIRIEFFIENL